MSSKNNPLSAAFGIDNDDLGEEPEVVQPKRVEETRPKSVESPSIEEVEPGVVSLGGMLFVQDGEDLVRTTASVPLNMRITAIEKHRLKSYADRHRLSMTDVVRDALKDIIEK